MKIIEKKPGTFPEKNSGTGNREHSQKKTRELGTGNVPKKKPWEPGTGNVPRKNKSIF
jgi:hypothetical protein